MNKNILKLLCLIMCIFMLVGCGKEEDKEDKYFRFKEEIVTIYVGETYEIEYETNIKNPEIKVDDEEIASIEGNVATGLSRGYASIYVEVDGEIIEMVLCVDKKKQEIVYHDLYIDGDLVKVREGSVLKLNLKEYFNGDLYILYDDKKFVGWFLDEAYTQAADLEMEIMEDIHLYGKYEVIQVVSEERIVLDNIVGYKGEFKKDADVQTISPSFGTVLTSDNNNFEAYTFVFVRYDVDELDYFVTEIVSEGAKANTVIPYDGFIICVKKDCDKYNEYMQNLVVGAKISLSKYSVNKAGIVYVNETYTPEQITINPVGVDCKYYSVYDVRSKYMIYSYQGDQKAYPASVTKVITAIAALSNAKLEDQITVGAELDITYEGSSPSTAGIKKGQVWTLRQLLYALLLPSGNDAGYEIAALTINSLYPNNNFEAHEKIRMFSDLMNEVCAKVGANNSHFLTPDGNSYYTSTGAWDERISNHYLTANDMIKIANYAFTFGAIAEVVQTASMSLKTVDGSSYSFTNTNQFLRPTHANYFEYVVGLKTGTTNPAGNCIVTAAEINRRFVIIATFYNYTSAGRYTNSRYLYDLVFKAYN
ncbi:MAG: D-alanyl-D-alanine carboxypeptidase [Bacilli bacterium]|nr:D-alanyl-D-alanine carboxypeptidase [Bacilli bacterium]